MDDNKPKIIKPTVNDCKRLIEDSGECIKSAREYFKNEKWHFVVRECIDSMELSLKGILGLIIGKYPVTHDFQTPQAKEIYKEVMGRINKIGEKDKHYFEGLFIKRLFFIPSLWSSSYTNAKYGDSWGTDVYQKLESEFIIKQAEEFVKNAELVYDNIVGW